MKDNKGIMGVLIAFDIAVTTDLALAQMGKITKEEALKRLDKNRTKAQADIMAMIASTKLGQGHFDRSDYPLTYEGCKGFVLNQIQQCLEGKDDK